MPYHPEQIQHVQHFRLLVEADPPHHRVRDALEAKMVLVFLEVGAAAEEDGYVAVFQGLLGRP